MLRDFVSSAGLKAFLRKLAVGLPVNLAVGWFMFSGHQIATLVFGFIAAVAGSLVVMAFEPRRSRERRRSAIAQTLGSAISKQRSAGPAFPERHRA